MGRRGDRVIGRHKAMGGHGDSGMARKENGPFLNSMRYALCAMPRGLG